MSAGTPASGSCRATCGGQRRGPGGDLELRSPGLHRIAEQWPRDDVIHWLNEYFDVMAAPVERHGGEILKFVGDGMLAIFRLETPEACNNAFRAAVGRSAA